MSFMSDRLNMTDTITAEFDRRLLVSNLNITFHKNWFNNSEYKIRRNRQSRVNIEQTLLHFNILRTNALANTLSLLKQFFCHE